MKTKRNPPPKPLFEEIIPLLIDIWRKIQRLPKGPADRLQTREFRSLVEAVVRRQTDKSLADPELLGAYLLYDWLLHYAQGLNLLQELPNIPRKVLDLSCKSAPFSLAALQYGAKEVLALELEERALAIGAEICGKMGYPLSARVHDSRNVSFPLNEKWDLIIVGHSLFSLYESQDSQVSYISSLLTKLSQEGHLLIVDSSLPTENRKILALRDRLVQKGASIQAPCIWKGECPALKSNSYCYAQRPLEKPFLLKEIQRAANINLSSLKMSYLLIKSSSNAWPELPSKRFYRAISPPVETFRGERHFLCGLDGKKTLGSRLKEMPKHSKAYSYLQRGDLISVENPLEGKDDMEIIEETKIFLEAPAGKPLPS